MEVPLTMKGAAKTLLGWCVAIVVLGTLACIHTHAHLGQTFVRTGCEYTNSEGTNLYQQSLQSCKNSRFTRPWCKAINYFRKEKKCSLLRTDNGTDLDAENRSCVHISRDVMDNRDKQGCAKEKKCDKLKYQNNNNACGKTTFVKELLQHHDSRMKPCIQRIVWLYRRWQPLYALVQRTVLPRVQFIQGIPGDLDDDDFFDPTVNNLLVVDDLFSEAGKDKRITGLYTEGSHHRSLSVIGINQNLFGTKDPTQRRNCHYLILFKNPMDSQVVMSLARQMYPGRSDLFIKAFSKATKEPYSYLLVDLKPFTPETERLKSKVVWQDEYDRILTNEEQDMPPLTIKEDTTHTTNHSSAAVQTVNTDAEQQDMSDKMNSCDDCGLLFDTAHDVQRHVKRGWCAESQEPPMKRRKLEETESESSEIVEDNEGYTHLWELAKKEGTDRYKELYDRFVSQGDTEEDASDLAKERVKAYEEKCFFSRYSTLLEKYWIPLQHNAVHQTVLRQIQALTDKGVASTSALTRVLRKHKTKFEDLFDTEVSGNEQDSDSEESTDEDSD